MILIIYFIITVLIYYLLVQVPIKIAESRGISGGELNTIKTLSWCGIFIGITWIIAIILSLVWQPANWVEKKTPNEKIIPQNNLDVLERLSVLKEKGIISEQEFQKEKDKILLNM